MTKQLKTDLRRWAHNNLVLRRLGNRIAKFGRKLQRTFYVVDLHIHHKRFARQRQKIGRRLENLGELICHGNYNV